MFQWDYFFGAILHHIAGNLSAKESASVEICASGTHCAFLGRKFLNFLEMRFILSKTLSSAKNVLELSGGCSS